MSRSSELEHVVLGLVWRDGPCTPYAVRQHFLSSPTPGWSGSAGAIYPLVRRLEERGLLHSEEEDTDGRGTRRYRITPEGTRALRGWMLPPFTGGNIAQGADAARTRLFFVDTLEGRERDAFLAAVEEELVLELARLRTRERGASGGGSPLERLAARGATELAQTRLRWWRGVRRELGG